MSDEDESEEYGDTEDDEAAIVGAACRARERRARVLLVFGSFCFVPLKFFNLLSCEKNYKIKI